MVQQINLINPSLRKKRDLLTAVPLAMATVVMLLLLGLVTVLVTQQANTVQAEADKRAEDLKAGQARLADLGKLVAESKPDPKLAEELENARNLLSLREEIVAAVEGGAFGKNPGFSGFMQGFTRQVPRDLWLTGFVLRPGGDGMEVRGRMLDPNAMPAFIRRLSAESVFQGLNFSSLIIDRPPPEPVVVKPVAAAPAPVKPVSAAPVAGMSAKPVAAPAPTVVAAPPEPKESPYVEFVLRSKLKESEAAAKAPEAKR